MQTITVNLANRSYPIYLGENLLNDVDFLRRHVDASQVLLVSNPTIAPLYLSKIQKAFQDRQCDHILLPDGESHKNLDILKKIFDELLQKKHHRQTTLIALGGGVICDLTGFAAACYQRGVAYLQIPTTLLAQVDASIGGKTAVNHPLGKNMIGAFYQPRAVIIDITTLTTLPDREFYAGIAEIIKVALIKDAKFFTWLEDHMGGLVARDTQVLLHAIQRACELKAEVVTADETEMKNIRALLNLGHTFGHAIEQVTGYTRYLHGEAVAFGIMLAAKLSQQQSLLNAEEVKRIQNLLQSAHLPIDLPAQLQCDKMLAAMTVDKKIEGEQLRLVLLKRIGHAELVSTVNISQVRQLLTDYGCDK
jgi:3-dehydroquinate synthase